MKRAGKFINWLEAFLPSTVSPETTFDPLTLPSGVPSDMEKLAQLQNFSIRFLRRLEILCSQTEATLLALQGQYRRQFIYSFPTVTATHPGKHVFLNRQQAADATA